MPVPVLAGTETLNPILRSPVIDFLHLAQLCLVSQT